MITPIQQAASSVISSLMQSVIDDSEKRRLEDEEKARGKKDDKVLKASVRPDDAQRAANDKINAHFFNSSSVDVNALKVKFIANVAKQLGIVQEDGESGYRLGSRIADAINHLGSVELFGVNAALGTSQLGISLDEIVEAIKNPFGEKDDKLEAALEERATGISGTKDSRAKILQRLESVANPKTLEELKLEKSGQKTDPTKVEDAETKAERDKDIAAREAGAKLEDVKALHEAIAKTNDQKPEPTGTGEETAEEPAAGLIDTIQILAAGAEQIKMASDAAPASMDAAGSLASQMQDTGPVNANGKNDIAMDEKDEVTLLQDQGPDMSDTTATSILALDVDENGIYKLLGRKKDDSTALAA